jgi:hypothetical protein
MELTYDSMVKFTETYFKAIAEIDPTDKKAEEKIRKFFAPTFFGRQGWPAFTQKLDVWVNYLLSGDENHWRHIRTMPPVKQPQLINHGPSPLHMMVDEKNKMVAIWTIQKYYNRKTNVQERERLMDIHLGFTLINGEIKLAWEIDSVTRGAMLIDAVENRVDTTYER